MCIENRTQTQAHVRRHETTKTDSGGLYCAAPKVTHRDRRLDLPARVPPFFYWDMFVSHTQSQSQSLLCVQTRNHNYTHPHFWVLDGFGSTERRLQRLAKVVHPGPNTSGWLAGPFGSGEKEKGNTDKFSKPVSNSDAKRLSLSCESQK